MPAKEIYRRVIVDDSTRPQELGFIDKLRLVLSRLSQDDKQYRRNKDLVLEAELYQIGRINLTLEKVSEQMRIRKERKSTLRFDNELLPFVRKVIESEDGIARFYDFEVIADESTKAVKSKSFIVIMTSKGGVK